MFGPFGYIMAEGNLETSLHCFLLDDIQNNSDELCRLPVVNWADVKAIGQLAAIVQGL